MNLVSRWPCFARIAATPRPRQYAWSAQFSLPVVDPRPHNRMSREGRVFVGFEVKTVNDGRDGPNSVGPMSSGSPRPVELYVSPGGDSPMMTSATAASRTTVPLVHIRQPRKLLSD